MKNILGAAAVAGIVTTLTVLPGMSATPQSKSSPAPSTMAKVYAREHLVLRESAPGDAYFGRLKMSYLGINNVFKDASVRAGDHTVDPDVINKLKDADESLQAWVQRYPHDPELARSYFLAAAAYKKVWIKTYQDKAWRYMHVVVEKFPQSYFGKHVKKDIALGFTEHYYADALPCAPATPSTAPSLSPEPAATTAAKRSRNATPSPSPSPSAAPTPQATESPSPLPAPTAKTAPDQLKVDIVAPDCAQPASPAAIPQSVPSPAATRG